MKAFYPVYQPRMSEEWVALHNPLRMFAQKDEAMEFAKTACADSDLKYGVVEVAVRIPLK